MNSTEKKDRIEALQKIASDLEMSYVPKDEFGTIGLLRDFHLFQKGHSKSIVNLMQKSTGLMENKISIFDYIYKVGGGKAPPIKYMQTVFFIQSKSLALPEILLKPETFFHKVGAFLGMQDIDFDIHPEFSDRYLLQGEEENRIRQVMTDKVIRFFTVEKDWCMESIGFFLILYRHNSVAMPDYIRLLHDKGMKLYHHLKSETL